MSRKRVIAVRDAKDGVVNIFGYGHYVGDHPNPGLFDIPNPKIELDNGGVVWGCECWWGDADKFKEKYKDWEIKELQKSEGF